jgi:hypothetical protein
MPGIQAAAGMTSICVAQALLPVREWNLKDAGTDRSVCATQLGRGEIGCSGGRWRDKTVNGGLRGDIGERRERMAAVEHRRNGRRNWRNLLIIFGHCGAVSDSRCKWRN